MIHSPYPISSVQSLSLVDSLRPHELKHTRSPCRSPTPRVYSNPCPLSQWCHPSISSSVIPFSSCLQSFPASGSFQISQFFTSGSQSIGVSASASVLPMDTQDWSPLRWTGWISLQSKGLSRVFSNNTVQKHQFSALSRLYGPTLIHTWLLENPWLWLYGPLWRPSTIQVLKFRSIMFTFPRSWNEWGHCPELQVEGLSFSQSQASCPSSQTLLNS